MLGHKGIPGNERADEEAKWAAQGNSSRQQQLPTICRQKLLASQSATHQSHRKAVYTKDRKWFKKSPRCQQP